MSVRVGELMGHVGDQYRLRGQSRVFTLVTVNASDGEDGRQCVWLTLSDQFVVRPSPGAHFRPFVIASEVHVEGDAFVRDWEEITTEGSTP